MGDELMLNVSEYDGLTTLIKNITIGVPQNRSTLNHLNNDIWMKDDSNRPPRRTATTILTTF